MIFVLLSVNKAVAFALEIVAVKSVAFRLASVFKLMPLLELLELDELLLLLVELLELLLVLACSCTVALVGGLRPIVCTVSRLTCIKAKSMTTSGDARAKLWARFS